MSKLIVAEVDGFGYAVTAVCPWRWRPQKSATANSQRAARRPPSDWRVRSTCAQPRRRAGARDVTMPQRPRRNQVGCDRLSLGNSRRVGRLKAQAPSVLGPSYTRAHWDDSGGQADHVMRDRTLRRLSGQTCLPARDGDRERRGHRCRRRAEHHWRCRASLLGAATSLNPDASVRITATGRTRGRPSASGCRSAACVTSSWPGLA